jgi:hypothetical protein
VAVASRIVLGTHLLWNPAMLPFNLYRLMKVNKATVIASCSTAYIWVVVTFSVYMQLRLFFTFFYLLSIHSYTTSFRPIAYRQLYKLHVSVHCSFYCRIVNVAVSLFMLVSCCSNGRVWFMILLAEFSCFGLWQVTSMKMNPRKL